MKQITYAESLNEIRSTYLGALPLYENSESYEEYAERVLISLEPRFAEMFDALKGFEKELVDYFWFLDDITDCSALFVKYPNLMALLTIYTSTIVDDDLDLFEKLEAVVLQCTD